MARLVFPYGPQQVFVSASWSLSFDDLHRLRPLIRRAFRCKLDTSPRRVLGCLRDDETSLAALLFLTELTDYMPINPKLSDAEMARLSVDSGADTAVVSGDYMDDKRPLLGDMKIVNWDDVITEAMNDLANETAVPDIEEPQNEGRLILHTSGSTGLPKRVPISITAINASAQNIAKGHALCASDHALNALPTFHIGALVDVLLAPLSVGGSVSITDRRTPAELAQTLSTVRPTWVQIVPTILRRMVEDLDPEVIRDAGASLDFIRSISAPVPPDLKEKAERLFGCPVVEMYGMTETAGQITTNSREQDQTQFGSVGRPVGTDIAILDRFGNPVETRKNGEVCVAGESVFDGYEDMSRDEVFFGEWFRTGDLGSLDEHGNLFLQGRLKEMINVGGEKVSPHEVEVAVQLMPEVVEAAAYAIPHPTLGEQVGLTIAVSGDTGSDEVRRFLEEQLADFKRPNAISIVDQLPRLANAKVDRVLLKREGAQAWVERQTTTTSQNRPTSKEAAAISTHWMQILKCRAPEGEDDFFDMGGDSLSATQLLLDLEKSLRRDISPSQLFESPTFSGLIAALSDAQTEPTQPDHPAVRYVHERTTGWPGQTAVKNGLLRGMGGLLPGQPLFWASQDIRETKHIANTLGKTRPFHTTGSLRRFKNRQESDFVALAEQLASEIDTIQPDGTIALGGFCGGAWVMHYTADRLRELGRDIQLFISFDYWSSRVIEFPTVHCMSNCPINSARGNYAHHSLAEHLIHPNGAITLEVDSKHRFNLSDIAPHLAALNRFIDDGITDVGALCPSGDQWTLEQRQRQPNAKIRVSGRPRFYKQGDVRPLRVRVTNTSDQTWEPTSVSGLSVQVDLVNLDNHMRKACAGVAVFEEPVHPGEDVEFAFDIHFPDKRIPLWMSCCLVSQGVTRFHKRAAGGKRTLVFPHLSKARSDRATASV